jgi:hypothetical protein
MNICYTIYLISHEYPLLFMSHFHTNSCCLMSHSITRISATVCLIVLHDVSFLVSPNVIAEWIELLCNRKAPSSHLGMKFDYSDGEVLCFCQDFWLFLRFAIKLRYVCLLKNFRLICNHLTLETENYVRQANNKNKCNVSHTHRNIWIYSDQSVNLMLSHNIYIFQCLLKEFLPSDMNHINV